jgi:hypothetical protein
MNYRFNSIEASMTRDVEDDGGRVIAIRVSGPLMACVESRAADEGLSLSAVCRRAVIRDLGFKSAPTASAESAEAR